MSNSRDEKLNSELPLDEFEKQIPTKKYNDILKLKVLESDFDNTMQQYQRTYQTYISYTKQQVQYEWRSRYPVQVNNMNAQINERFPGNVTRDECFASCANDDKCKYVLWSNTGPSYCAPNKCKKFTAGGNGMKSSNGIVESNPMCASDALWKELSAELRNPFFGWESFQSILNRFPTSTNYKYHGWEKPSWKKYGNTVTYNNSGPDWIGLGNADSVDKCNQLAQDSSDGPFDWTISQNGKNCKAHKISGQRVSEGWLYGPNNGRARNLPACYGECDSDAQCRDGLKCFQRSYGEKIPGCRGSGSGRDWDYCYDPTGGNLGGRMRRDGSTLSKPPGGQTGMVVASRVSTVQQLKALNARLLTLMQEIYTLVAEIYPKGIGNEEQSKYELERIRKKNKRLLADREKIIELDQDLSTLEGQNETLKLQHDANQLLYLGMSVLLVGVAGITYKVMTNKSN